MLARGVVPELTNPYCAPNGFSDSNFLTEKEQKMIAFNLEVLSRKLSGKSLSYGEVI